MAVKCNTRDVACNDCGIPITVPYTTYTYYTRNQLPFRCKECSRKHRSEMTTARWNNKTEEEKKEHGRKSAENWKNLPDEKRQQISISRSNNMKKHHSSNGYSFQQRLEKTEDGRYIHTGIPNEPSFVINDKERIYIKCMDCGQEYTMSYGKYRKKPSDYHWRCKSCRYKNHSKVISDNWDIHREEISKNISLGLQKYWDNMDPVQKLNAISITIQHSQLKNQLHQKFEKYFNETLKDKYTFQAEYHTEYTGINHWWDYAILDKSGELECLVDLDGAYFHADRCDYNGIHSKESHDERRGLTVPDWTKWCIIYEKEFEKSFKYLLDILPLAYDRFVDKMFKEYRMMPFPYPEYNRLMLQRSYYRLTKLYYNKHSYILFSTRNGDRLAMHFHKSIFHARIGDNKSPHDIWKNDDELHDMIFNHELLHNYINKNKIVQGFNLNYRVRFMSAGQAKLLIEHYLPQYTEIFDPFSEFSGRMLGTISLGKRYIGQDASEISVRESNQILDWLHENMYEFDARVTCADSYKTKAKYQCLFTSLPRIGESYEDVPETRLTCDEWIDICLSHYECKKYMFVVDDTKKYADYVVTDINNDKLIIIEGSL